MLNYNHRHSYLRTITYMRVFNHNHELETSTNCMVQNENVRLSSFKFTMGPTANYYYAS